MGVTDKRIMKNIVYLLFVMSGPVLSPLASTEEGCTHDAKNFRCVKYIKNYDADTVTFHIPSVHPFLGKNINIRVAGVDTPEVRTKNQCEKDKARNAKKLVKSLLKSAKRIDLVNVERGKYFRIV